MPSKKAGRPARGKSALQRAIDAKGLTQADVARALEMPVNALSAWCLGRRIPHPVALLRLSKFLGVPMETLGQWDEWSKAFDAEVEKQRKAHRPT